MQPVVGVERLHPLPLLFPALQDALVNGLAKRVFEEHDALLRIESGPIAKPLATAARGCAAVRELEGDLPLRTQHLSGIIRENVC